MIPICFSRISKITAFLNCGLRPSGESRRWKLISPQPFWHSQTWYTSPLIKYHILRLQICLLFLQYPQNIWQYSYVRKSQRRATIGTNMLSALGEKQSTIFFYLLNTEVSPKKAKYKDIVMAMSNMISFSVRTVGPALIWNNYWHNSIDTLWQTVWC